MSAEKIIISKEELRICIEEGMRNDEIAEKFFCNTSTIERRLREYGLRHPTTIYNKKMYLRMMSLGMNEKDIAFIFGVTIKALRTWRWRHKL